MWIHHRALGRLSPYTFLGLPGNLLEGYRRVVHLALGMRLLDLGQLLLELFHLGREVFRPQRFGALHLGMNHKLGEQKQADIVVGALVAGLEGLVDDGQQPQQVDEEKG